MTQIVDRRLNGKNKSADNRRRFFQRFKTQLKKAVSDAIADRSISDIEKGERITIPAKDIKEPRIYHGHGGIQERIHPGNKEFITGDSFERPPTDNDAAAGSNASNSGEGVDDFVFDISREEFIELFFEDLELPELVRKKIAKEPLYKMVRAGYTTQGTPANINIIRSLRNAIARRISIGGAYKKQLTAAEKELALLLKKKPHPQIKIAEVEQRIENLKAKIARIPFIDTFDLRFNHRVRQNIPSTQAVMFCLMDVSGSMDEVKKDIAKRFFILLYLFLTRNYQHIELVFIRHHTSAKEVDEKEFFYSRETGGTVVSSALELMKEIIAARYSVEDWNIYAAQASDGDNWNADSPYCKTLLTDSILPLVRFFAYVEILPRHHQSLWESYSEIKSQFDNFAMQGIDDYTKIYPVFHKLFKRKPA